LHAFFGFSGVPPSPPPKTLQSVRTFHLVPESILNRFLVQIFSNFYSRQNKFFHANKFALQENFFLAARVEGFSRDLGKSCVPKNRGFFTLRSGSQKWVAGSFFQVPRELFADSFSTSLDLLLSGWIFFLLRSTSKKLKPKEATILWPPRSVGSPFPSLRFWSSYHPLRFCESLLRLFQSLREHVCDLLLRSWAYPRLLFFQKDSTASAGLILAVLRSNLCAATSLCASHLCAPAKTHCEYRLVSSGLFFFLVSHLTASVDFCKIWD
jgi:hypothetical protein